MGPGARLRGPFFELHPGRVPLRADLAILVLAAALGAAGCRPDAGRRADRTAIDTAAQPAGVGPVAGTPGPPLETFRGHVSFDGAVRSFQPCASDRRLGVQDRSGRLRDLHVELRAGAGPDQAIFVVVRGIAGPAPTTGFAPEYEGEMVVADVRYAALEGHGCGSDWAFRYRAAGNEPFWAVTVTGDTLRLQEPGSPARVWRGVVEQATPDGIRIAVSSDTTVGIELLERACRDSMSGAFSALSARLRVDGRERLGCAIDGAGPRSR